MALDSRSRNNRKTTVRQEKTTFYNEDKGRSASTGRLGSIGERLSSPTKINGKSYGYYHRDSGEYRNVTDSKRNYRIHRDGGGSDGGGGGGVTKRYTGTDYKFDSVKIEQGTKSVSSLSAKDNRNGKPGGDNSKSKKARLKSEGRNKLRVQARGDASGSRLKPGPKRKKDLRVGVQGGSKSGNGINAPR